jgi:hypothetical protein
MSRRVVVLLVVLGVVVPYCALGGALWLSRGSSATPATFTRLFEVVRFHRVHHVRPGAWPPVLLNSGTVYCPNPARAGPCPTSHHKHRPRG